MYERYYKLTGKPFRLTPDPRIFFRGKSHGRAHAYMRYGLQLGEGFVVITGDIGTGKTTIARMLLEELSREHVVAAQITSTQLSPEELLRMIAVELGLPAEDWTKAVLLRELESLCVERAEEGRSILLVIDEAQNLVPESLEELRMLSNFQIRGKAPLQSFLLGQNEFRDTLQSSGMEQFRQRIIASCHLDPLDKEETRHFIEYRLNAAGWQGDPSLTEGAHELIFTYTGGIPRRINTFCDRLFLYGCLEQMHELTEDEVSFVICEKNEEFVGNGEEVSEAENPPDDQAGESYSVNEASLPRLHAIGEGGRRQQDMESRLDLVEERLHTSQEVLKILLAALTAGDDIDMKQFAELLLEMESGTKSA